MSIFRATLYNAEIRRKTPYLINLICEGINMIYHFQTRGPDPDHKIEFIHIFFILELVRIALNAPFGFAQGAVFANPAVR